MNRGVMYMAYGPSRFFGEAVSSVKSFKKIDKHEGIPTCLVSPEDVPREIYSNFDDFIKIKKEDCERVGTRPGKNWQIKFLIYDYSPFDTTLFLDSDTFICKDISWGFGIAEEYNIGAALTDAKYSVGNNVRGRFSNICHPQSTQINSGVMFFKKDEFVKKIFSDALELSLYDKMRTGDQTYLTLAMYKNKFNPYVFHSRFMCKGYGYNMGNKRQCSNDWRNPKGPYFVLHHPRIAHWVQKFVQTQQSSVKTTV